MKKLFVLVAVVFLFSFVSAQGVDHESKQSVYVLEQNGLGSSSLQYSLLYTPLARWEAAILFGQYADQILDRAIDSAASCSFWDVTASSIVYADIIKSCQLWLLKWSNGNFNPYGSMTRWQLIMVVARMLSQDPSLELDAAYNYLLQQWVIKVDDRANSTRIPWRNEVYIMLARFLHNPTSSSTQPIQQTLLIRTYTKDPLFGNFVLYAEWSAALLSQSTLLTNAHVVSDVSGEPTWFYEVCRVDQIGKDPICFSSAILTRVDTFEDLALLQLPKPYTQWQPVTLRTRALRAGDALTVVGFPYDGWTTITTTQWIVAGFEGDMIKTDAAVNYGNSWWGAYDAQWNFVGVPTALYGNIGYVVPISTVQSFLADDSVLFTLSAWLQSNIVWFVSFMEDKHRLAMASQKSLVTDFFAIKDLQWFTLSAASEYKNDDIVTASYTLTTSDKKTNIFMDVYYIAGVKTIDAHVSELLGFLEQDFVDVDHEEKTYGSAAWHILTAKGTIDDKNALTVYYVYVKDGGLFMVRVVWSASQLSVIQKTQSIVSSLEALSIPAASSANTVSLWLLTVPVPSFASIEVSVDPSSNQSYLYYDPDFSEDYASLFVEECGCSLSDYVDGTIDVFLEDDTWNDEDVKQSWTFMTVDGFQWYYIDNMWDGSRVFRAVVKVVDPHNEDTVLSVIFQLFGWPEISDAHIEMLKNYVKTIRVNGKNPFTQ